MERKSIKKFFIADGTSKVIEKKVYGKGSRRCRACRNHRGFIRKFGLNICRRCFREYAPIIGFKTYD